MDTDRGRIEILSADGRFLSGRIYNLPKARSGGKLIVDKRAAIIHFA